METGIKADKHQFYIKQYMKRIISTVFLALILTSTSFSQIEEDKNKTTYKIAMKANGIKKPKRAPFPIFFIILCSILVY